MKGNKTIIGALTDPWGRILNICPIPRCSAQPAKAEILLLSKRLPETVAKWSKMVLSWLA
eukprot:4127709-Pleurochrysis_carterae.AAC.3